MSDADSGAQQRSKGEAGIMASVRRFLATLIETVRTRAQILATEFEEEREHVRELVLYGAASLFFLGLSVVLFSLLLVALFWDSYRLTAIGGLAVFYFAVGCAAAAVLRGKARKRPRMLSATLAELAEDQRRLGGGA